ncbi:mitochondrial outer membrane protein porin 2-like [Carica papaya]|uniref:mitochondrial outer membrane protein porin 2-like n=1 Tax=Carica papaya TaxID=3649 RepID=UPI000B8C8B31|nr:mitochondrial outer membrane protein porin 2-like [Carica papaya]
MSRGPGLFSDFGKHARDLLNRDYNSDQKFSISSSTGSGVALVSSLSKKGSLCSGDVATQYKHKNTVVNVKIDTESNISTTFSIFDILLYSKVIASFKLPDQNSGKLEVQYLHEHASFTTAVGLKHSPAVDISATIGTPTVAFGAEASYMTASGEFLKYNAGVSLKKADCSASVIL